MTVAALARVTCSRPRCGAFHFERQGQEVIVTNVPGGHHQFQFFGVYAAEAHLTRLVVVCEKVTVRCRCGAMTLTDLTA